MSNNRTASTVIANTATIFSLPGWFIRRAVLQEGEAGLLLHKDTVLRAYDRPGRRILWVWDDLLPGVALDKRQYLRARTQPFTLSLRYPGLPTGDGAFVACQADLTVQVATPLALARGFPAGADAAALARALQSATQQPLEARTLQYQQADLCASQRVGQEIAADLTARCGQRLGDWGARVVGASPISFAPVSKADLSAQQLAGLLDGKGLLAAEAMGEVMDNLSGGSADASKVVTAVLSELLEEQGKDGVTQAAQAASPGASPLPRLAMLASVGLSLAGIGGGAVAQQTGALGQMVSSVPVVNTVLGPVMGFAAMLPLSLIAKWGLGRLFRKGAASRAQKARSKREAREQEAWDQVQLQRAHDDLAAAHDAIASWPERSYLDPPQRQTLDAAQRSLQDALAMLGTGFTRSASRRGRTAREGALVLRFRVAAKAMPVLAQRLTRSLDEPAPVLEGLEAMAGQATSALRQWQTLRLHMG